MHKPGQSSALPSATPAPDLELVSIDPELRASIEVLVIDDEHSLRESCASLLRTEGFTVTTCGRGDDAMRLVRTRRFDIVLLDLKMPNQDGMELLTKIRRHFNVLPVLVVRAAAKPAIIFVYSIFRMRLLRFGGALPVRTSSPEICRK